MQPTIANLLNPVAHDRPSEVYQQRLSLADLLNPIPEQDMVAEDVHSELSISDISDSELFDDASLAGATFDPPAVNSMHEYDIDIPSTPMTPASDSDSSSRSSSPDVPLSLNQQPPSKVPEKKQMTLSSFFSVPARALSKLPKSTAQLKSKLSGKRKRDSENSGSDTGSTDQLAVASGSQKKPFTKAREGTSKGAVAERKLRDAVRAGTHEVDEEKEKRWRKAVQEIDPNVEFRPGIVNQFLHIACGEYVKVKNVYDVRRARTHIADCKRRREDMKVNGRKKGTKRLKVTAGTPSLQHMVETRGWHWKKSKARNPTEFETRACPGLTADANPRVDIYLRRTENMEAQLEKAREMQATKVRVAFRNELVPWTDAITGMYSFASGP